MVLLLSVLRGKHVHQGAAQLAIPWAADVLAELVVPAPENVFQLEEGWIHFSRLLLRQLHEILKQVDQADACVLTVASAYLLGRLFNVVWGPSDTDELPGKLTDRVLLA